MLDQIKSTFPFELITGAGSVGELACLCETYSRLLIVTSEGMVRRGTIEDIASFLKVKVDIVTIGSNPDLDAVDVLLKKARDFCIDAVVAIGGGSVLDTGKVLSVLLHKSNEALTLADVLRHKSKFSESRTPLINIPTTSGTGAEVTPFATIWDKAQAKKRSFASDALVPDAVILDPLLTLTAPLNLTIDCALDTCSHAMESLWNKNATDKSAQYAKKALQVFSQALPRLLKDLTDLEARAQMQKASFLAGLAIAISRTAIAHSISYPLTLHYGVPHGLACSFTLPEIAKRVIQVNAWAADDVATTINEVLSVLKCINLEERINAYCSFEERCSKVDEMFTPGRGDNFVLSSFDIKAVL